MPKQVTILFKFEKQIDQRIFQQEVIEKEWPTIPKKVPGVGYKITVDAEDKSIYTDVITSRLDRRGARDEVIEESND